MVAKQALLVAVLAAAVLGSSANSAFCPIVLPSIGAKVATSRALSQRPGTTTVSRVSFPEAFRVHSGELSDLVAQFYSSYHSKLERSRRTLEATWARQKAALKADLARMDRLLGQQRAELEEEWNQTFSRLMALKPASVFPKAKAGAQGRLRRRSKGETALYSTIARSVSPRSMPPPEP
uniref:Uncharacterized protein n=1 Tax=Hemiselmis tepida TaxID=464990 RepID=A0A7S0VF72_9CRYP|mmetsp:Transcript_1388/g.3529  ORF Transcript_1388/g.3529 Transcript_1388/m.3529 type:complete len:179 (+) Transcript_1388:70-606(+)